MGERQIDCQQCQGRTGFLTIGAAVPPQVGDKQDIKKQVEHISHDTAFQQVLQVDTFQAEQFRVQGILLTFVIL